MIKRMNNRRLNEHISLQTRGQTEATNVYAGVVNFFYHQRRRFTSLISTERLFLKMARIIANPTTTSAAATDSEKKTRI